MSLRECNSNNSSSNSAMENSNIEHSNIFQGSHSQTSSFNSYKYFTIYFTSYEFLNAHFPHTLTSLYSGCIIQSWLAGGHHTELSLSAHVHKTWKEILETAEKTPF